MRLATSQVALGEILAATEPLAAESSLKKALDEQSALLNEYPGIPEYQLDAGRSHYQLGLLLVKSNPHEAVLQAEKARKLHSDALRSGPTRKLRSDDLPRRSSAALPRPFERRTPARSCGHGRADPRDSSARTKVLRQRCRFPDHVRRATDDTPTGRKQSEDCLARAVGVLRKAVQAKVISSPKTLDIKDFDPLRKRDDFIRLRDSLDESPHIG